MSNRGWIGIDLDGTLAVYDKWSGIDHIGDPIIPTLRYVLDLLHAGIEVRIFTARVQEGALAIAAINEWTLKHIGQVLPVTDRKDMNMVFCLDDRAVAVQKNTGVLLSPLPSIKDVLWHHDPKNPENPAYDATV